MQSTSGQSLDPLATTTSAILAHPRFNLAVSAYIPRVMAWRRRMGLFNRVGTTLGLHICNFVTYLHFASRAGDIEHGATYSNILEICERRGQCGARALRTTLSVLRVTGYLEVRPSLGDARARAFVPGPKLVRELMEGFGLSLSVLDSLEPGQGFEDQVRNDAQFFTQLVAKSGREVVLGQVDITEAFPDLHAIIMKAGGFPTSISVADACLRAVACPTTRSIASEFSITQSQVRNVLIDLGKRNLISRDGNGNIISGNRLVHEHRTLIARELALHIKYGLGRELSWAG